MSNLNEPTRITPNESTTPKAARLNHHSLLIENRLKDILLTRYNKQITDELADLQLDLVENLEVLMDIEEFLGLAPEKIPDEEFKKCLSFRDMMNCIGKYV